MRIWLERTWALPDATALQHRTVAALAVTLPGAASLFRGLGLGACRCAQDRTLAVAASEEGLSLDWLVEELESRARAPGRVAPDATGALIDFIVARYHERHRAELPRLIALAAEVEHVEAGRADAPTGLAEVLDGLRAGLGEHMLKEELRVFPLMRAGRVDLLAGPLALMRGEHEDNAQFLLRAEHLTLGYRTPADARPAWRRLVAEVAGLAEDVIAHIHLEESTLFPGFGVADAVTR